MSGLTLVGHLSYKAALSLHLVLHSLKPPVGQSHVVAALSVAQAVLSLLVTKPGLMLGILHSVLELIGSTVTIMMISVVEILATNSSEDDE